MKRVAPVIATSRASCIVMLITCIGAGLLMLSAPAVHGQGENEQEAEPVQVGLLVYDGNKSGVCFSSGFLDTVRRETDIKVASKMKPVRLDSDELFAYPFVVLSGEKAFTLSDTEKANFKRYLEKGGFVVASAGCSNRPWQQSFTKLFEQVMPDRSLDAIDLKHPVFHSLFDIDRIDTRKGADKAMYELRIEGRLAMIYSPLGLNDTANAGKGCCCCGGNEVRNAREINANLLVYALTH